MAEEFYLYGSRENPKRPLWECGRPRRPVREELLPSPTREISVETGADGKDEQETSYWAVL